MSHIIGNLKIETWGCLVDLHQVTENAEAPAVSLPRARPFRRQVATLVTWTRSWPQSALHASSPVLTGETAIRSSSLFRQVSWDHLGWAVQQHPCTCRDTWGEPGPAEQACITGAGASHSAGTLGRAGPLETSGHLYFPGFLCCAANKLNHRSVTK